MKIQISKWLIAIATFVSLMFVVTGLEAGKPGKPNPNKPVTPDKNGAEYILFSDFSVGDLTSVYPEVPVVGCCLNSGPWPAYTMHLSSAFGKLEGDHDGQLYIGRSGVGRNHGYMVEFWVEGKFGFYFIGGEIERDKKTKYLKVTFTEKPWHWHDLESDLPPIDLPPIGKASFVLERYPAD